MGANNRRIGGGLRVLCSIEKTATGLSHSSCGSVSPSALSPSMYLLLWSPNPCIGSGRIRGFDLLPLFRTSSRYHSRRFLSLQSYWSVHSQARKVRTTLVPIVPSACSAWPSFLQHFGQRQETGRRSTGILSLLACWCSLSLPCLSFEPRQAVSTIRGIWVKTTLTLCQTIFSTLSPDSRRNC